MTVNLDNSPTALYGIKPEGEMIAFIESLTSYIVRLADAHVIDVSDLVAYEIAPLLKSNYVQNSIGRGGNRFYDGAHFLNGYGASAKQMVQCLNNLTGNKELENLTLTSFSQFFSTRYLVRKNIAWCSKCLEENLYYPLIWSLSAYTFCTIHSVYLQEVCFLCKNSIPFLHRKSKVGVCPYCKKRHFGIEKKSGYVRKKDMYISNDLEKLFVFTRCSYLFRSHMRFRENLRKIVGIHFGGVANHFANYMGIPKTTMSDWYNGKSSPSLNQILELSFYLGISSLDFYKESTMDNINIKHLEKYIPKISKKKRLQKNICKETVEMFLMKKEKATEEYCSLTDIARELNCSTKYLYSNFHRYCKSISSNNKRIKENVNKKKNNEIIFLVKEQFQLILATGEIPTRTKIEKNLNMPCVFKNRVFKDYYFQLYVDFELMG
ncbi:hypothetical protein BK735_08795 [Bacillus mycoides]|uniref:helix-turn-helix domain-containing protein n=1 Tax=Bacillus mycoides TaxID=1405 RepID=UPI000B4351B3|nr:helix-turn-helix domain-containing protein [Bacillus mycoides]OTY20353.1 hypothetical protein BK735_08795 [Bacillus mycoides]